MQYVYILLCVDGLTYVGCTSDLKERIQRHIKGQVPATLSRLPVILVFYSGFKDKYKAYEFEKYLKTGSGRVFIRKRLVKN
jgi:putative endonuclease